MLSSQVLSTARFVIPHGRTLVVSKILFVQEALASLLVTPHVFNAATAQVGDNGYMSPWLQLSQLSVSVSHTPDLGLTDLGLPQLKSDNVNSPAEFSGGDAVTPKIFSKEIYACFVIMASLEILLIQWVRCNTILYHAQLLLPSTDRRVTIQVMLGGGPIIPCSR